jgi:hypothetical protein
LTIAIGRGLGGEPDFLEGAGAVDQHPVGAHFRKRDTRCDFRARAQCQRRSAVHRQQRNSLTSLALRNDANQLDVAPVGARQRAEEKGDRSDVRRLSARGRIAHGDGAHGLGGCPPRGEVQRPSGDRRRERQDQHESAGARQVRAGDTYALPRSIAHHRPGAAHHANQTIQPAQMISRCADDRCRRGASKGVAPNHGRM